MLDDKVFVTVCGLRYHENPHIAVGTLLLCLKEPDNEYDDEAIRVEYKAYGHIGYIANSHYTVANGTYSAGRIYDKVENLFFVRVYFNVQNTLVCAVEPGDITKLLLEYEQACAAERQKALLHKNASPKEVNHLEVLVDNEQRLRDK